MRVSFERVRLDQTRLVGKHDSLCPIPEPDLAQHPSDVGLYRGLGDADYPGNLLDGFRSA